MMRRLMPLAFLALAGCLSFPSTPNELRQHSASMGNTSVVSRSPGSVFAAITKRAQSCMNYRAEDQIKLPVISSRPPILHRDVYRTRTEKNGSRLTMVVEHYNPANTGVSGFYPRIVADIEPAAGGTRVTTHAPLIAKAFPDAIHMWAKGNMRPCPKNDLYRNGR